MSEVIVSPFFHFPVTMEMQLILTWPLVLGDSISDLKLVSSLELTLDQSKL